MYNLAMKQLNTNIILSLFSTYYTSRKTEFKGGVLFSACPSFCQHLRILLYNFDSFLSDFSQIYTTPYPSDSACLV